MNIEEIKIKIIGQRIIKVEATEWEDKYSWLSNFDSVRIHLENGIVLDSEGEPVRVELLKED